VFKVAITDYTFDSLDVERTILQAAGCEIVSGQCKTPEALIPLVAQADAVIAQFAPVNADVISAMQFAKVIVRYGIGVDNVDLDAARDRNIPVCNVPDYCIDEVADQTLACILCTTRQIISNSQHVRDNKWGLASSLEEMKTLRDLTVGCAGFGRIGREVLQRLAPFKCRRLVHDPFVEDDTIKQAGCESVSLETLLAESDVVTLHCPSTSETHQMLNTLSFRVLRPGAIIINVARGDLIETQALIEALESGQVAAAALDVCDPEPIPLDSPLRTLPNVIATSHIASASVSAVTDLRETAARIAAAAVRGEPLPNIVNGV
jgi:D-3-phosphoglycerate dehydrogenase / 2-oxoglutarate reductase